MFSLSTLSILSILFDSSSLLMSDAYTSSLWYPDFLNSSIKTLVLSMSSSSWQSLRNAANFIGLGFQLFKSLVIKPFSKHESASETLFSAIWPSERSSHVVKFGHPPPIVKCSKKLKTLSDLPFLRYQYMRRFPILESSEGLTETHSS